MYRFKQTILLTSDFLIFTFALYTSLLIRNWTFVDSIKKMQTNLPVFFILFLVWIIINYINGLYNLEYIQNEKITKRMIEVAFFSLAVSIGILYILPYNRNVTPKTILILSVIISYLFTYFWRIFFRKISGFRRLQTKVLFFGYNNEVTEIINIINKRTTKTYKITAIIEPNHNLHQTEIEYCDLYKNLTALRPLVTKYKPNLVVVSPHMKKNDESLKELYHLLFWPVKIIDLTSFYETLTGRIPPSAFSENWFLKNINNKENIVYEKMRELINLISIIILGIFFIILTPPIALLIKLTSKGPVFYKQDRTGQYTKIFKIYKFRTMNVLAEDGSAELNGVEFAQKNDNRITNIGKILRKTRLDELPQVINLLKRELDLIGPRPERPEIVEKLEEKMPYYSIRHTTKPGITGWAAINQHYTNDLETSLQKLQYDLYYIKNRSILLDLSIILKTINVVLRGMGQ